MDKIIYFPTTDARARAKKGKADEHIHKMFSNLKELGFVAFGSEAEELWIKENMLFYYEFGYDWSTGPYPIKIPDTVSKHDRELMAGRFWEIISYQSNKYFANYSIIMIQLLQRIYHLENPKQ